MNVLSNATADSSGTARLAQVRAPAQPIRAAPTHIQPAPALQQVRLITLANAVTATTGGMVRAAPTKSRSLRAISAPVRQSATTKTKKSPALQKAKISTASLLSMRQKEHVQT